jgi:hypothetical protein
MRADQGCRDAANEHDDPDARARQPARDVSTATRSVAPAAKSSMVRTAPLSVAMRAKRAIASVSRRTPP